MIAYIQWLPFVTLDGECVGIDYHDVGKWAHLLGVYGPFCEVTP